MDVIIELILCWAYGLLEVVGEVIIEFIAQFVAEVLSRVFPKPFKIRKPIKPALSAIGYFIFGALAGYVSLLLVPHLFIKNEWLRLANLVVTPVACGLMMVVIGIARKRRGQALIGLDTFGYGAVFAFGMALVRYIGRG